MLYIDITDLLEYARYNSTLSGIQRVSVMLITHFVERCGVDSFRLIGYHPNKKTVEMYSPEHFSRNYDYDQFKFCSNFGVSIVSHASNERKYELHTYVKERYSNSLKRYVHLLRLPIANALSNGRTYRKKGIVHKIAASKPDTRRVLPGDTVFIPGATWNFNHYLDYLGELSNNGVRIIQFVHDLIPLVVPEHVDEGVPQRFAEWLYTMGKIASVFVTNSLATEADLKIFLSRNELHKATTLVIPLAHEFLRKPPSKLPQNAPISVFRPELARNIRADMLYLTHRPYVLAVGTIEPRKNVWTLVNIWKSLYEEFGERLPQLVLAGKRGWRIKDFDDFMQATGSLYGYIRIADRPTDEELAYFYENCLFSVFLSYYEGWGLPIGECLWFGRPVVASSSSSMPEVGGAWTDYVDPHDFSSIRQAVHRMIVDHEYREQRATKISRNHLRTWTEFADDLWGLFLNFGEGSNVLPFGGGGNIPDSRLETGRALPQRRTRRPNP